MKAHKAVRAESVGQKPVRSELTEHKPLRPEATMHTDAPVRKSGGRLSREDQRRLGDILQRVYDEVIRQGVPDRFKELLNDLDQSGPAGEARVADPRSGADAPEAEPVVGARALDHNKGSH
jgi:anti-sigma factor NepR-like protein